MTFPIPNSLQEYFGNLAVRNAVDSLAAALDGENAPQMGWDEARNYNQALLMAAQVRADLVDLLFRVWDATFGQANTLRLGVEYFDGQEDGFPAAVWRERHVERYYYPDEQTAENDGRSDGLFVWLVPPTKRMSAVGGERYSEGDEMAEMPANAADGLQGWHVATSVDDDYTYFSNQPVDITEFLDNPCPVVERFRRDAIEMVEFLAQN